MTFLKLKVWENYLPNVGICTLTIDRFGNKWFCTNNQLYKLNNGMLTPYPNVQTGVLATDRLGHLYIGSWTLGFLRLEGDTFVMYKPPLEPFGMLIVSSIALDDKDHIWIGSEESGLHQFDNTIWQKYPKPFCFFKNMVTALVLDSKGCLWVGTWFGLRKFENPTESNHEIDVEIEVDFNFSIPGPMTMDEQEQEAYFAHNYPDKELKWIDSDWSDDYKDVVNFYGWDRDNRDVNLINCLASDSFGNLWVGSGMGNGRGLSKFDGKTWTNYNTFNSGIPTNSVRVLATDHLGGVWIGSTVGLTFFNGANWITYNTLNSGLLNDRVTAIAIEAQGTIWVGTDAGLSEFKRTL